MNPRTAQLAATLLLFAASTAAPNASAQAAIQPQPAPAPATIPTPAPDPVLTVARDLIGEALFLRAFPSVNTLTYDSSGRLEDPPPTAAQPADWTVSAVNILKASRPSPGTIYLEGVRAAVRYNPDAHEFQRHPQNPEKMRLTINLTAPEPTPTTPETASAATARRLRTAFAAIFAVGIDPALQRSMPPLWSHFFDPSLPWPPDALTGQAVYQLLGQPGQPKDVTPPLLAHRVDARFSDFAARDRVTGQVQLRAIIDQQGIAQRIVVARPLGYGLEQQAAEAVSQWRFEPATRAGSPVAAAILINVDFEIGAPLH